MSDHLVTCRKYQKVLPGLAEPPMPTALGKEIYENISAQAWAEWQELQTMLINEHHLSLLEPDARKFLNEQMQKFLSNDDFEKPEGYTPIQSD